MQCGSTMILCKCSLLGWWQVATSGLGLDNIIFIDLMKVEQAQHMMEEVEAVIISPVIIKHS